MSFLNLAWSHDGTRFAAGASSTLYVLDAETFDPITQLEAGTTVPFVAWAPNSNRLLFSAKEKAGKSHPMISIWQEDAEKQSQRGQNEQYKNKNKKTG